MKSFHDFHSSTPTIDGSATVARLHGVAAVTLQTGLAATTSVASRTSSAGDLTITLTDTGWAEPAAGGYRYYKCDKEFMLCMTAVAQLVTLHLRFPALKSADVS